MTPGVTSEVCVLTPEVIPEVTPEVGVTSEVYVLTPEVTPDVCIDGEGERHAP